MTEKIRNIFIISLIAVFLLTACSALSEISSVNKTGATFMTTFKEDDPQSSWDMLTPEVQTEVGSLSAWTEFVSLRNFSEWKFSNTQVDNATAQMDGQSKLGVDTYSVRLVFLKINESWKISGVTFKFLK
ncbi:MAG: hypothetical protein NTZ74_16350 [Chloroflexi bacterium]|nr:hypothetical protein [Chloroflexota bacterium]